MTFPTRYTLWTLFTIISGACLCLGVAQAQTVYREAPQLAEQVEAGDLPAVQQRLPSQPMVVPVVERIGEYGGTWRTALRGPADVPWLFYLVGYEPLVRWDLDGDVIPNVAQDVEANDDATVYTFTLREGMRWSDGAPFTADDIMFWYEAVFMNEELTPIQSSALRAAGEPVLVEKVDDITVRFTFAEPKGFFLQDHASSNADFSDFPRHYMAQFHAEYNPEGIGALVQQGGFDDWMQLFNNRRDTWTNPEKPTLNGWMITTPVGQSSRVVAERNPYYWKIDAEAVTTQPTPLRITEGCRILPRP